MLDQGKNTAVTTDPMPLDEERLSDPRGGPGQITEARAHLQEYLASRTLLEIAARNGWNQEAERLLECRHPTHPACGLALCCAADLGNTVLVDILLARGADVHADNDAADNGTVQRAAALGQHAATAEVFLLSTASALRAMCRTHPAEQAALFATLDGCAAAIPTAQRPGMLKAHGKQMPTLAALVQQDLRRQNRAAP